MKQFFIFIFLNLTIGSISQNIDTKLIDITKNYAPEISITEKEREQPTLIDTIITPSKQVNYTFFSVPVVSTFTPDKGKALRLLPQERLTYNNSYATLGGGNYTSIWADAWVYLPWEDRQYFTVEGQHLSSMGGISGVNASDAFSTTSLGGTYVTKNTYHWESGATLSHRLFNWYGTNSIGLQTDDFSSAHHYFDIQAFTKLKNIGVLRDIALQTHLLKDNFDSSEFMVKVQPQFSFNLNPKYRITVNTQAQVVKSSFREDVNTQPSAFTQSEIFVNPSFIFQTDILYGKVGGTLSLLPSEKSPLALYPDIELSIPLIDRLAVIFAGVSGGTQLNSYQELSRINPFIRPNVQLLTTKTPYIGFVGIHGIFDTSIYYHTKASFGNVMQQAFFDISNEIHTKTFSKGFPLYRSFKMVYDNTNFLAVEGNIEGKLLGELYFNVQAKLQYYRTETLKKVLYTPVITSSLNLSYNILPHWRLASDMFFVGQRHAMDYSNEATGSLKSLKPFFDINLNTQYTFNKKWAVIVRLNNVLNQGYQQWLYYPVQRFQVNAGVQYQFNSH